MRYCISFGLNRTVSVSNGHKYAQHNINAYRQILNCTICLNKCKIMCQQSARSSAAWFPIVPQICTQSVWGMYRGTSLDLYRSCIACSFAAHPIVYLKFFHKIGTKQKDQLYWSNKQQILAQKFVAQVSYSFVKCNHSVFSGQSLLIDLFTPPGVSLECVQHQSSLCQSSSI